MKDLLIQFLLIASEVVAFILVALLVVGTLYFAFG
jgi:hypothetical protein